MYSTGLSYSEEFRNGPVRVKVDYRRAGCNTNGTLYDVLARRDSTGSEIRLVPTLKLARRVGAALAELLGR